MDIKPVWEEKSDLPLAGGRRATGLFRIIYSGPGARWFLYGGAIAVGLVSLLTGWPGAGMYGAEPAPTQVITQRQVDIQVVDRPVVKTVTLVQHVPVPVGAVAQVPFAPESTDTGTHTVVRAQLPEPPPAAARPKRTDAAATTADATTPTEGAADPETAAKADRATNAKRDVAKAEGAQSTDATDAKAPPSDEAAPAAKSPQAKAPTAATKKTSGKTAVAKGPAKTGFDPDKIALETGKPVDGSAPSGSDAKATSTDAKPIAPRKTTPSAKASSKAAKAKTTVAKTAAPTTGATVAKAPPKSNEMVFISSEDPVTPDPPAQAPTYAPAPPPSAPPVTRAPGTSQATVPGYAPPAFTPPAAPAAPRRPQAPPGSPVTLIGRLSPPAQGTQTNAQVVLVDMTTGATVPGALQGDGTFSFGRLRSGSLYYIVAWQHVRNQTGGQGGGTSATDLRMSWHQVIQASDAGTFAIDLSRANCDGDYTTDVLPASVIRSPGSGRRADLTPIGG